MTTKIKVLDDSTEYTTREGTGEWDGDDTTQTHHITGIAIAKDKEYYDLEVGFEVKPEDKLYLVYVLYNTGNSFGSSDNHISFVDLFKDRKKAEALANQILNHAERNDVNVGHKQKYSTSYLTETGKESTFCPSWVGYFESLNEVVVEPVSVEDTTLRLRRRYA